MKYSDTALEQLTEVSEGLKLKAYPDPGTKGAPWTIGYGHTKGVTQNTVCTQQQAENWLIQDISDAEKAVNALVTVTLTQHQFDALVDFVFNEGFGNFKSSTLLRLLNAGRYTEASAEFKRWVYGNGVKMPGLVTRRALETVWFNTED